MLYSPIQEVPTTPVLRARAAVQQHGTSTLVANSQNDSQGDFAVVPDDYAVVPDFLDEIHDLSSSVPRTPVTGNRSIHQVSRTPVTGNRGVHQVSRTPVTGNRGVHQVSRTPVTGNRSIHQVSRTPVTDNRSVHQELLNGASRSARRENLPFLLNQGNTPRRLLNSPAGLRSSQEQIVPRTPIGGQSFSTPKTGGVFTPGVRASGSQQANTPTSRQWVYRKKYIRTSKLCFELATSQEPPKCDLNNNGEHVVDAKGDNRPPNKKRDVTDRSTTIHSQEPTTSTGRGTETTLTLDPNVPGISGSERPKDFLDLL